MKKLYTKVSLLGAIMAFGYTAKAQTLGNLWGLTQQGGEYGGGVLFDYNTLTPHDSIVNPFVTPPSNPGSGMLLASDGNFYGVTSSGGASGNGTIFKCTPSGTITTLYSFAGGPSDGAEPSGYDGVIQGADGNLYGMTLAGGDSNQGIIFKCTTSGTETVLHSFAGGSSDGFYASGKLTQATDGNLYGVASGGGPNNYGILFQCTTSGTETVIYYFTGGTSDGSGPNGGVVQGTDGYLYGMASGGLYGIGVIFKCSISGTETVLYNFGSSGPHDANGPNGILIQGSDGNLYGVTEFGGTTSSGGYATGYGTIFQCTTSGTETVLHSFAGPSSDGQYPFGSLFQASDGNLYGSTIYGGTTGNYGTIFQCTTSGTETLLHSFAGTPYDGSGTYSTLIQGSNGNLYGLTAGGGLANKGAIFECTTSGTESLLSSFGVTAIGYNPTGSIIKGTNGNFYGMTQYGGSSGMGTIFQCTPSGTVSTLYSFAGGASDGANPNGSLIQGADGNLYGMTPNGGTTSTSSYGTLFTCTTSGTESVLHIFGGSDGSDGSTPYGDVIQGTDGNLYGMTFKGGSNSKGTIFECTTSGTETVLHNFAGGPSDGEKPYGSLIQGTDGNLYGLTENGGASIYNGTLFTCTTSGTETVLYSFGAVSNDGAYPYGSLIQGSDGNLYGTTTYGGTSGNGIIFQSTTSGTETILYNFAGRYSDGANPYGNLIQGSDGNLYGMTEDGGISGYSNYGSGYGTLFKCTTSGTETVLMNFTGAANGANPNGSLLEVSNSSSPCNVTVTANATANVSCNGGSNGIAVANPGGGTSPYTYSWNSSPAKTTDTASGLTAGTYTVTVTDANSCSATASATITQPTTVSVTASVTFDVSCNGGSNGSATANIPTGGTPFPGITTVAGNNAKGAGYYGDGGAATSAELFYPHGVAVDGSGNIFIADQNNDVIREVGYSTGNISTVAGNNAYGNGYTGDGGPATSAELNNPGAVAVDGSGNIFIVVPGNNVIREVNYSTGNISTVAGTTYGYNGDGGPATSAELNGPIGVAADGSGNIYIADYFNNIIREVNLTSGIISTVAGNYFAGSGYTGDGEPATSAELNNPGSVAVDASGNIFISDNRNNVIREVNYSTGNISTVAGRYIFGSGYNGDGGPATSAELNNPAGVAVDGSGNIFIADLGNSVIREVKHSTGYISTLAGNHTAGSGYSGDGGIAISAELNNPTGIAVDGSGNVFIADQFNQVIRKVVISGSTTYIYSWAPAGGTNPAADNLSAGTYTVTAADAHGCSATAKATISQPAILAVPGITTVNVSCYGDSNGTGAVTMSGGITPYTYSWAPAAGNSQTIYNLKSGTYTSTIADNNGCSTTASVTINQPASPLAITISGKTNVLCRGGTGSATANSASGGSLPYKYVWTPAGGTNLTTSSIGAGTYTVVATDNNGCRAESSVTITQPAGVLAVSISSYANVLCHGSNTGAATANRATGGISPYTYSWTPRGGTNPAASDLSAETYTVTVTDSNGCTAKTSVTITQPASAPGITLLSQTNVLCYGNSTGSATAKAASGGTLPYTYSWSTGGGSNLTVSNLGAGTDTITVTDAHGCAAAAFVTISQPSSPLVITILNYANASCFAGTGSATANAATNGTPAYKYSWAPGGGTNLTASGLRAGTYTITATDVHSCTAAASVTITQPASALAITMFSHSNIRCHGVAADSATANAATGGSSPYAYSWSSGGGNNLTAYNFSAGTYTLTATDNQGCTASASVTITQPATALAVSMSNTVNVLCNGNSTGSATSNPATGGTLPYTYSWTSGATNLIASGLSAGTYTLTATDAHSCIVSIPVSISQPATPLGITISSQANILCYGGKGSATANAATGGTTAYKYSWAPAGGTNLTASGLTAGTYTVTATDAHSCTVTAGVTIIQPVSPLAITIFSHSNIRCHGVAADSATANAATGGSSPYAYSWSSGGGNNLTAYNFSAGTYTLTATDNQGCTASASVTITQPATALAVSMSNTVNVLCNGNSTGSATSNPATGGTLPYTYSWTSGATNLIASGLSAGTYTLTATDAHSCIASIPVSISQPASPLYISILNQANVSCNGGKGSATANAATGGISAYKYSWTPGGGTNLIASSLNSGTYTITATDAHGCTATADVTITQPLSPLGITMFSHSNILCHGVIEDSATANAATGGTSPYTYNWTSGGGANLTVYNLATGTYTITATDNNGCTSKASVTITQPNALAITPLSQSNILCNGNNTGSATAKPASGGTAPYTYNWTPGGGAVLTASGLSAGTYTLTATDAHECNASFSITITQPVYPLSITISNQVNVSCYGGRGSATANAASGGTSAYKYSWTPTGGTNLAASGLSGGTYTITATDSHGCTATASVTITQPVFPPGITMFSHSNILCRGVIADSATANTATGGTSPYTYRWTSNGGTNLTAYNFNAGSYTITATDNHGCNATASVTITQPASALAVTLSSQTNIFCYGNTTGNATAKAPTGGTSPYTFNWTPGGGANITASSLSAGTYTMTTTDAYGCNASCSVTITQIASVRDSVVTFTCNGGSSASAIIGAKGGTIPYTYRWSPGGGTKSTMSGLSDGTYTITIIDKNGCNGSVLNQSFSCAAAPPRNGDNSDSYQNQNPDCCPDNIILYPNPNTGQFTISGIEKGMIIEMYDYTGRRISNITASDQTMLLNISAQANGIYLVRIISKETTLVSQKKVVKTQ